MKDPQECHSERECKAGRKADGCVRDMWKERGEELASSAIHEMGKEKDTKDACDSEIKFDDEIEAMVDAFMDKCGQSNSDPLDVVEHIAKREGIKVSEDVPDGGTEKDKLRKFLIAVVRRIVVALLFHVADKYGMGAGSLLELILGMKKGASARCIERSTFAPEMSFRTFRVFFC